MPLPTPVDLAPPAADPLRPPLPRFAQIEPVGRCNLACRMCTVNERGDTVAEMPLARFEALLDQLPDLQELHLQGLGEPMLHPHFFDMVALAAGRGIRVSANTNLTLLTEPRARQCVDSGLSVLSVSLDGASAATYEAIRRKASFAKVVRNLGRLTAARDAAGSALQVRGVMVLMRGNMGELPDLVDLLHTHGVHELLVQRLSNDWREPDLPRRYIPIRDFVDQAELRGPDLTQAAELFAQARRRAATLGFTLHLPRLPAPGAAIVATASASANADSGLSDGTNGTSTSTADRGTDRPLCRWPWDQLYITAAGELLPCCMVATADRATFGRVAATDGGGRGTTASITAAGHGEGDDASLLGRWHGETARAFRAALSTPQPPSVCRTCALYRGEF